LRRSIEKYHFLCNYGAFNQRDGAHLMDYLIGFMIIL
jgi:hypothetical protein